MKDTPMTDDDSKLLKLAERCETEQPSYDLNDAICKTTAGPSGNYAYRDYANSLDAAMTLAGEPRRIEWCGGHVEAVVWRADDHRYFHSGKAATPALALCAAALRARASGDR